MTERGPAWDAFSLYIRLRDAAPFTGLCVCITCGHAYHYKQMDAGHFIAWNKGNATKYHEQNVNAQCKRCNGFGAGEQYVYAKAIDRKYGPGTADRLFVASKTSKKFFPFELKELAKYWKKLALQLKAEKKI